MITSQTVPIPFSKRILWLAWLLFLTAGLYAYFYWVTPAAAQAAVITIPSTQITPTIDGSCTGATGGEYGDALSFDFADAFKTTGKVFLKQDNQFLYVCMLGASSVDSTVGPFASVYLDTDNGKEQFAQNEDLGLHVTIPASVLSAHRGTGSGNYTPDPTVTGWDAKATTGNADQAEWRIPLRLLTQQCGNPFGLAVYHHWIQTVGDDYGWPSNTFYDSPKSWQEVMLAAPNCAPDLTVTKRGLFNGATISYTIDVVNNGNAPATNVKLVDTLPGEVHFVSSTPGAPTCSHSGEFLDGALSCDLGTLAPGASQTIIIVVWPVKTGRLINKAEATLQETDLNPKDNSDSVITSIDAAKLADLSILKTDSADPIILGQEFTYKIEVKNNGDADTQDVVVSDTLPAGVLYLGFSAPPGVTCSEAGGVVTCNLGTVPNGGNIVIEIKVRATAVGVQVNKASVSQRTPLDPNPANNEAGQETTIAGLSGKIAYVFRQDTATAADFKTLLESRGFTVHLIRCQAVLGTDFTQFHAVLIADDTGSLNNWCAAVAGANHIAAARKPIIGLGEGGYAFFGQLGKPIGWPNGWHGPLDRVKPDSVGLSYWHTPTDFGAPPPNPTGLYTGPVNAVGIHLPSVIGVLPFGLEPAATDHAPLLAERADCNQLWGFSGGPVAMMAGGKDLFVNAVVYALGQQCAQPPTPPENCIELIKSAEPPDGTPVPVGAVITYHLKYQVKSDPACATQRALLEDPIPPDTLYVPGSASDGITPGADHVLRWNLGALAPGASGEKKFQVYVTDAQCNNQRRVVNRARLITTLGIFVSNTVTHPVNCPPVVPQGTQPPYAEDEIQIYPYPLVAGGETEVSVRIRNLVSVTQQVTVSFETSPNNFGIGISFGAIPIPNNPRLVTLPPFGVVEVKWQWTPTISGHYCVRIRIQSAGHDPVFTYRNLDVMENLQPGVEDTLPFAVGNPKITVQNILLVVDNTCPGWQAWVNPDSHADPLVLANMTPGEVRTATLHVIPPTDRPLGTACHIDVQGWIGSELIGGIRKLDVPPVHLPHANPSWMEKEISTIPSPPIVGQPAQICIELNNPMPFARTVSVDFAVADFGAGIPFTPVGNLVNIVLPPNSINKYCITWTPTASNNLHRCILVTLKQAGFQDQQSQRNVDLRRFSIRDLLALKDLEIPFTVGNTALFSRTLEIRPELIGLPLTIKPKILPDPPPELAPGQQMTFKLGFLLPATITAADAESLALLEEDLFQHGDAARVEVGLYLDDEQVGGFSAEFAPPQAIYLPMISK